MSDRQHSELSLQDDKTFFNKWDWFMKDHICSIIALLLLIELFIRYIANSKKHFFYDILTEFYNIILATKQSFIHFIVIRFVNIWDPAMCTY
jgi:hypothetical protein